MCIHTETQKVLNTLRGVFSDDYRRQRTFSFNNFAIESIFTNKLYHIRERNLDPRQTKPTFTLSDYETGLEFYLLPKFITGLRDGKINWCTHKQWEIFKQFSQEKPLFLLLGTGENPVMPARLHLLPFEKVKAGALFPVYVNEFTIEDRPLTGRKLWGSDNIHQNQKHPELPGVYDTL